MATEWRPSCPYSGAICRDINGIWIIGVKFASPQAVRCANTTGNLGYQPPWTSAHDGLDRPGGWDGGISLQGSSDGGVLWILLATAPGHQKIVRVLG
eukprot:120747-Prorocentrum_minimum.AAC.3